MSLALLLAAWPESRVLADDAQFLVVDKLAGIPVHGGDERALDDLIGRLRARDAARGGNGYFGVHQRLDKEVSGLLFLNRDPADNRLIAEETAARRIERRYLAVVAPLRAEARALEGGGTLEHQLGPTKGGATRVVGRGGQRAVTHYRVRERTQNRALVSVRLETGRKHQIRAQLAHIGYPIVGDSLYGGAPAPRLMLHCESLRLPAFEREFSCAPPDYLTRWYAAPGSLDLAGPASLLVDAGCLRWQLAGKTEAFRLVNDSADLMPGVTVDVYGDYAALSLSSDAAFERRHALAEALIGAGARGVYLKTRVRADLRRQQAAALAPEAPLAGTPPAPQLCVREGDRKLEVDLADGLSTGLFVDQRDNRTRVGAHSRGRAVLNLFAYTCSFSVAAALGGAREVVSVDLSKRALERGRKNFELNGLDPKAHRFIAEDALKWLDRAARRGERFDLAIVDPPSFSSKGKGGTFSVAKSYVELVCGVLRVLGPGGTLLAVTNHKKTSPARLRAMLLEAAERVGRPVASLRSPKSGIDCPDTELGPHPSKSAWLRLT
ncbi:MAG TPA: class I SAM-dependent methyltransferase [Polyangiaceae bacterium]|nr:class I SAM-dependent methyltransferase [Polyangiaceae bacterium]